MDWKQYEDEIFDHFRTEFPKAKIVRNAHIPGRFSQVLRQVDILIDDTIAGFEVRIAIDAKHHTRPLDVIDIEAFLGFCSDVGAHKGVMVSLNGYTKAAANRAHYDNSDIELDVLPFGELKQFQAFGALPYAGGYGVVLPAPFGWIIDGSRRRGFVAALYQRGFDLEQAQRANEWMYVNFWVKEGELNSLEKLLLHQASYMLSTHPQAKIDYRDGPEHKAGTTKIRCFEEKSYPAPEYTGFVEFDKFIFFCVMYTPREFVNRNLRKLNFILKSAVPFTMTNSGPNPALQKDTTTSVAFLR
jgi:hypothetical protein